MPVEEDINLWLTPEDVEPEVTVKITSVPKLVPKEDTGLDKDLKEMDVFLPNGEKRVWTANLTSRRALAKAYGLNSDNWVDKYVTLKTTEMNVRGKVKRVIFVKGQE